MANDEDNPTTPLASKPSPNPIEHHQHHLQQSPIKSQSSSSHSPQINNNNNVNGNGNWPLSKTPQSAEDFILSVASKIASQPLQYSDPDVWGVLTAISDKARKRHQGINMLLTSDEHCIGRLVDDPRFQILSPAISANHCKIYRKRISTEDVDSCISSSLKDSSTNGTYLNWERLNKSSPEAKLQHGDIISIPFAPQHELSFAFVYREVLQSTSSAHAAFLKRKADELGTEGKRLKGIGIGASEGPISLDDFRSLQRSNTELRKQLETQVTTIDSLRSENRAANERHETMDSGDYTPFTDDTTFTNLMLSGNSGVGVNLSTEQSKQSKVSKHSNTPGSSSQGNSSSINLGEDDIATENTTGAERPPGRKAEKARRGKNKETVVESPFRADLDSFHQLKHQQHLERMEQIAMDRAEREMEREERIMSMNLSNLEPQQVQYWRMKQEEVLKKYNPDG